MTADANPTIPRTDCQIGAESISRPYPQLLDVPRARIMWNVSENAWGIPIQCIFCSEARRAILCTSLSLANISAYKGRRLGGQQSI